MANADELWKPLVERDFPYMVLRERRRAWKAMYGACVCDREERRSRRRLALDRMQPFQRGNPSLPAAPPGVTAAARTAAACRRNREALKGGAVQYVDVYIYILSTTVYIFNTYGPIVKERTFLPQGPDELGYVLNPAREIFYGKSTCYSAFWRRPPSKVSHILPHPLPDEQQQQFYYSDPQRRALDSVS